MCLCVCVCVCVCVCLTTSSSSHQHFHACWWSLRLDETSFSLKNSNVALINGIVKVYTTTYLLRKKWSLSKLLK